MQVHGGWGWELEAGGVERGGRSVGWDAVHSTHTASSMCRNSLPPRMKPERGGQGGSHEDLDTWQGRVGKGSNRCHPRHAGLRDRYTPIPETSFAAHVLSAW